MRQINKAGLGFDDHAVRAEGVDDRQVNALKDSGKNVGVSENKTEE